MSPGFEEFHRADGHAGKERSVLTITTRGVLNLSEAAWIALGKPEAVVLMYARDEATIGLRPASQDDPNAYTLRKATSGGTRMVTAKAFATWIGADLSEARRYPLTVEDGIGCVRLRGPVAVIPWNRRDDPGKKGT